MKKSIIYMCGAIAFILFSQISAFTACADAQMPKWTVGDSWEYDKTMEIFIDYTDEVKYEVLDILTINIDNTNFEVYEMEFTTVLLDSTSHHFISTDDLSTVKSEDYFNVQDEMGTVVHTFHPPKKEFDFPLSVGKTWTLTYREEEYNDYWDLHYNTTTTLDYTVEAVETIDVEAGTFECYRIKSERRSGVVTYIWYSPEVKNFVKKASELTGPAEMELTSYNVADISDEKGFIFFSMPYLIFLILIPIILIVLILGLVMKRNKKPKETNTPMMNVQPYNVNPQHSFPMNQQASGYPPPQRQQPFTQPQAPFPQPLMQPQGQPIRCTNCYNVFLNHSLERPISVRCPYCGMRIQMD